MAALSLVAALRRSTLRPLGAEGRTVFAAQEQLRGMVASRLGPRHAALLAECLANGANDTIEWYSTAAPPFVRLSALDDAGRKAAMATIESLSMEIHGLAEELAKSTGERASAALLDLARRYPDDSCLYVAADGQPIIAGWGFAATDRDAAIAGEVRPGWRAPPKEPPPAAPTGPTRPVDYAPLPRPWQGRPWIGWGVVGFAAGAVLFAALWLAPLAALLNPAAAAARQLAAAQEREAGLRRELALVQSAAAAPLAECNKTRPPPPPPPPPPIRR